jgi:hypothetical protein
MAKAAAVVEKKEKVAKKPKATEKTGVVVLETLNIGMLKVKIRGTAPLILENWSVKTREQMRQKHTGEDRQTILKARNPEEEAKEKLYLTSKGQYAFPASGLKKAMISACTSTNKKIRKNYLMQALHVMGTEGNLVAFDSPGYRVQEDIGRVGMSKTPRPIWRPVFDEWSCTFIIRYNKNIISQAQIVNILNLAGFAVGLCGWRVEKSGQFGQFEVVKDTGKDVS